MNILRAKVVVNNLNVEMESHVNKICVARGRLNSVYKAFGPSSIPYHTEPTILHYWAQLCVGSGPFSCFILSYLYLLLYILIIKQKREGDVSLNNLIS